MYHRHQNCVFHFLSKLAPVTLFHAYNYRLPTADIPISSHYPYSLGLPSPPPLLHRNDLLGTSWMNRDTSIKIPFPCPHLDRDRKALQHLSHSQPNQMQSNNPLLLPFTNNLKLRRNMFPFLLREDVIKHSRKLCVIDFEIAGSVFLKRF